MASPRRDELWIRFEGRDRMEMSSGNARRHGPPEGGIHIPSPGGIMSVAQNTGIRKAVRQLLVAVAACTAVAGGATFAVGSDMDHPVTPQTVMRRRRGQRLAGRSAEAHPHQLTSPLGNFIPRILLGDPPGNSCAARPAIAATIVGPRYFPRTPPILAPRRSPLPRRPLYRADPHIPVEPRTAIRVSPADPRIPAVSPASRAAPHAPPPRSGSSRPAPASAPRSSG